MRMSPRPAGFFAFAASVLVLSIATSTGPRAADPPKAAPTSPATSPAIVPIPSPGAANAPAVAKAPGVTLATWWGHAAFVIVTPTGAGIAIDPWLENPVAPTGIAQPATLDAILVTHGHADHVGNAAQLAKKTAANLIAANELATLIGAEHTSTMTPGGSIKIRDATIHVVEAVHSTGYNVDPKNVRYGGAPVGFVIKIDKGPTIYHAGDTDAFSSMALIAERYKPTVAMLPIGGHFTMDAAGAAWAAKLLKVKTVIPMHFGTFPMLTGTPAELRAELKKLRVPAKVLEMKPGDTLKL